MRGRVGTAPYSTVPSLFGLGSEPRLCCESLHSIRNWRELGERHSLASCTVRLHEAKAGQVDVDLFGYQRAEAADAVGRIPALGHLVSSLALHRTPLLRSPLFSWLQSCPNQYYAVRHTLSPLKRRLFPFATTNTDTGKYKSSRCCGTFYHVSILGSTNLRPSLEAR